MADITWVGGSTFTYVTATSQTKAAPTGLADGDTLLAAVYARSTITAPSGWTKIKEITGGFFGDTNGRLEVYEKDTTTTSDSGADFTFSQSVSGRMAVVYAAMRNVFELVNSGEVKSSYQTASYAITPATMTPVNAGSMIVIFCAATDFDGGTQSPSVPTSFTLFSGSAITNLHLAGAYRAVSAGQANSGSFNLDPTYVDEELVTFGIGAITLLFGPEVATVDPLPAFDHSASVRYVADLVTPGGDVRVPISSWQATLNVTNDSYAQCVIPACLPYLDDINAATEFVITVQQYVDGAMVAEDEAIRFTVSQVFYAQGARNYTATISGYETGYVENLDPPVEHDRVLSGVQTVMTYPTSTTVRCAIDPFVVPAIRVYLEEAPMIVSFVNFYVTSDGNQYMDVGERTA